MVLVFDIVELLACENTLVPAFINKKLIKNIDNLNFIAAKVKKLVRPNRYQTC